jgi:hypothetical protein
MDDDDDDDHEEDERREEATATTTTTRGRRRMTAMGKWAMGKRRARCRCSPRRGRERRAGGTRATGAPAPGLWETLDDEVWEGKARDRVKKTRRAMGRLLCGIGTERARMRRLETVLVRTSWRRTDLER